MGQVCTDEARHDGTIVTGGGENNAPLRPAQPSADDGLKPRHVADMPPAQTAPPAATTGNTDYPIQSPAYTPGAQPASPSPAPGMAPAPATGAAGWEIADRPNSQLPLVSSRLQVVLPLNPTNFAQINGKYATSQRSVNVLRNRGNGDTYEGFINNGIPHGWGKLITANGGVVEGFFENGFPADYVRKVDNTGKLQEGFYVNGAFTGKGYEIESTGKRTDYENLIAGKPEGKVLIKDVMTQKLMFDGTLKGGLKNGPVAAFYDIASKSTLSGNFVNDLLEGAGKRTYDNGQLYEGEFKKGIEDGKGSLTFTDGRKWQGPFMNGKANGPGTLYPAGSTTGRQVTFKDGVKQG
jgi:hypothetical protein